MKTIKKKLADGRYVYAVKDADPRYCRIEVRDELGTVIESDGPWPTGIAQEKVAAKIAALNKDTSPLTRYACYLTGGNNDLCTHAWIDATPNELKAELARIKAAFEKAITSKKHQKTLDRKGYLSAEHVGGYNLNLRVGSSTHPNLDFANVKAPYERFVPVNVTDAEREEFPLTEDHDGPAGINPAEWEDQQDDDYSIRVTEKGIYFVVQTGWDEDDMDETPVMEYGLIP